MNEKDGKQVVEDEEVTGKTVKSPPVT